ncbi:ornithine carbamoyltransferase 1 [Escherichia coli]|nr:ornithine carbamoyltransferase 1 [Escherichia coli]
MSGFYHKHFLKLLDFTPAELNSLLQLAAKLKADKKSGKEEAKLTGKNIRAHLRKRLDPYPMLFRSCRI